MVDNNSKDGTVDYLRSIDEETRNTLNLKIILQKNNAGLSQATNVAVKESSGRWLLPCNPDIIFTEDTKLMLDYAGSHEFPILAPQLINPDGKRQYCMREFTLTRLFFNLTRLGRVTSRILSGTFFARDLHYNYQSFDRPILVEHPVASFLLISRTAIRELGYLFSLEFPLYFGDTDLFSRAAKKKIPIVFLPMIRIIHQSSYSRALLRPEIVQFMFTNSMVRYASKWRIFPRILKILLVADAIGAPLSHGRPPNKLDILCSAFRLKGAIMV